MKRWIAQQEARPTDRHSAVTSNEFLSLRIGMLLWQRGEMVQERRQTRAENTVEEPSAAYRRIPAALGKISTTMGQGQGWLSHSPLGGLGNSSLRAAKATECHCFC